jgi:uncharacterized OB-fold protein
MSDVSTELRRERPLPTGDGAVFWAAVAAGTLPIQRCEGCSTLHHPPRVRCPACGSFELRTVAAGGGGVVHSYAIPRYPPDGRNPPGTTFVVVELDEGVRMLSNLVDLAGVEPFIGMRVELCFGHLASEDQLPLWRPAGKAER